MFDELNFIKTSPSVTAGKKVTQAIALQAMAGGEWTERGGTFYLRNGRF